MPFVGSDYKFYQQQSLYFSHFK
uniref:Uncharacterized protein n=1 Tax=Arundo donax TaxID=35708 RepID=A0A0A9BQ61_ARUDO